MQIKRRFVLMTLTAAVLLLSACANTTVRTPTKATASPSALNTPGTPAPSAAMAATSAPSAAAEETAAPSAAAVEASPSQGNNAPGFTTVSPDGKVRIECAPYKDNPSLLQLKLVDIEKDKVLIDYDYPSDTEFFTTLWRRDGAYCALGYRNKDGARTVLLITKRGTTTTGKTIASQELFQITDSIHPDQPDAHIVPKEFNSGTEITLSVDWINAAGDRQSGTITWDYQHGVFSKLKK